jgi:hypothetical protein
MVFPKLTFPKEEGKAWALADHAGKNLFSEQWFSEMVKEGAKCHESPLTIHYHVHLNRKKMEIVRGAEAGPQIKDPSMKALSMPRRTRKQWCCGLKKMMLRSICCGFRQFVRVASEQNSSFAGCTSGWRRLWKILQSTKTPKS